MFLVSLLMMIWRFFKIFLFGNSYVMGGLVFW